MAAYPERTFATGRSGSGEAPPPDTAAAGTGPTGGGARFLVAAAHDLRQPFQAMQLFHHLLASQLADPKAVDLCERLGEAMNAAESLVGTVLDIAKLDAGLVTAEPERLDLDDLFARIIDDHQEEANRRGLRLVVRPTGCRVRTDPALLSRLLRALVANAVRFTRRGGVLVGGRRRGADLRIDVWDTGIGIAPADIPAIWEDFRQLGRAADGRLQGHGLGLALARRIARRLGHPLTVASRPGHGSVFSVTVPLAQDPDSHATRASR